MRFRSVLREHCTETEKCHEAMHSLVKGAAGEAREAGLTAEQFILWVKKIWDELVADGSMPRSGDAARTREVVISSAIKAYYVQ